MEHILISFLRDSQHNANVFVRSIVRLYLWLERLLVVIPSEFAMRLWYRLNPAVYIRSSRIVAVHPGAKEKRGSVYFIVAIEDPTFPDREFLTNLFHAIDRTGHNLVLVANQPLSPLARQKFLDQSALLIERKPLGREIGCYQDGILTVLERDPDASRIVLLSDSVYFLDRSLDRFVADLLTEHEFIGATETQDDQYAVQAFALSFGRPVIESPAFRRFWRKYKPISTRLWAIRKGEAGLTRALSRAGFRPRVLYSAGQLMSQLERRPVKELIQAGRLLPEAPRKIVFRRYLDLIGLDKVGAQAMAHGIERAGFGLGGGQSEQIDQLVAYSRTMGQWSLGVLANDIVETVTAEDQVRHGGFLFIKYLGLPLFKRDIFYRSLYALEDVYQFMSELDNPMRDDILADLRMAGTGALVRGLPKILLRHGAI